MKANVSKMLRSALSMFLALAMVIGMVPAAFAAEAPVMTGDLKTDLYELVAYMYEAGPDGIEAAIEYIETNGDGIEAYAAELSAILTAEAAKLNEVMEAATDKAALEAIAAELNADLIALKAALEAEVAKQNELLAAAAEAANEAALAEIESAIANCEETIANIEAGIEAVSAAQAKVDAAIAVFAEACESLRSAILDLDNIIVEKLNPAVEALNAVAQNATYETLESAAAAIADAKDVVAIAIGMVQEAYEYAVTVAAEAAEVTAAAAVEAVEAAKAALVVLEPVMDAAEAYIEERYNAVITEYAAELALVDAALAKLTAGEIAATAAVMLATYYEEEIAALKDAIAATDAAATEKLAELEAQLKIAEEKLAALKAMAEEEAEKFAEEQLPIIIAELEAEKAELEAAIAAAKAEVEANLPAIIAAAEKAYADAVKFLENAEKVAEALSAKVAEFVANTVEAVKEQIDMVVFLWELAYSMATSSPYMVNTDSKYVGIGDATAASASYVEDLYAELVKGFGLPAYENVASSSVVYAKDIAAQIPAVAGADLVTVGLGNVAFLRNALVEVMSAVDNGKTFSYETEALLDWSDVAGEWLDWELIEPIFMEIYEGLWRYEGIDKNVAAIVTAAIEAYAYSAVSYAVQVPALINEIRAVNPYAVVVLVGMYNPLNDMAIDLSALNMGVFDLSTFAPYIDILVDAASVHGKAYAMLTGNAIYVDAPAVETAGNTLLPSALLTADFSAMLPSAAGHKYIQTCIYEALGLYNPKVMRVFGEDRYETALAAASTMLDVTYTDKFETIVVATGRDYADALAGSYLAAVKNAPILLVKDSKADMVADFVNKNLAENGTVYVLGGEKAVSAATAAKLGNVVRLEGADRYATNLAILAEAGVNGGELLVATGKNYADALSASSTGMPVLLVSSALKAEQKDFLAACGVEKLTILGGEAAVSAEVAAELAAYAKVERVAGADRYETSALIADHFFGGRTGSVVVASGRDYPDALCGGALAAAAGVPVVLTKHGGITVADNYAVKAELGIVLGGEATGITKQDIVDIFELLNEGDIENVLYVG